MLFQYWYTLEQDVQCHRAGYNDLWEGGVSVQLQTGPVPHRTSRLVESGKLKLNVGASSQRVFPLVGTYQLDHVLSLEGTWVKFI